MHFGLLMTKFHKIKQYLIDVNQNKQKKKKILEDENFGQKFKF
jgi:hypothetical protein